MTDLTEERIAELRALLAKVTPGEWRADALAKVRCEADDGKGLVAVAHGGRYYGSVPATDDDITASRANATFIAAIKNAAPALLNAAEENVRLREALMEIAKPLTVHEHDGTSMMAELLAQIKRKVGMARAALEARNE